MSEARQAGRSALPPRPAGRGFFGVLPLLVGATVGVLGGTTFVLDNADELGDPWRVGALAVWAGLGLGWLWATFCRRHEPAPVGPRRHAGLVYGASVLGMLALIRAFTAALEAGGHAGVQPAAIALAVGLHFLPFAWAFPMVGRLFARLGAAVTGLGAAGLVLGLAWTPVAASACAVLAGLAMLALIAWHNLRH